MTNKLKKFWYCPNRQCQHKNDENLTICTKCGTSDDSCSPYFTKSCAQLSAYDAAYQAHEKHGELQGIINNIK